MRKRMLFLASIILLLASCNKEDIDSEQATTKSNNIHWYGSKSLENVQTRGVAEETKLWDQLSGISVKFINTSTDPQLIDKIKQIAKEWEEYAGIRFTFVNTNRDADVRIAFDWNNNNWLTWSYTGTDAKLEKRQDQPTTVFGGIQYSSEKEQKGDILRVFGQILGLEYEQRHQEWSQNGYWRDEIQLQRYWESQFYGYNMDWEQIREYVFNPLIKNNSKDVVQTEKIDELSIMAWPYYNRAQTSKLIANYELSEKDKEFIALLYPMTGLAIIENAWVNAGYFVWTDENKTAVKITELGAQQKYLPDVYDGEQLTSGAMMFSYNKNTSSLLKSVPKFNTSNITDFSGMFYSCKNLTEIPNEFNTSKGINFSSMFLNCQNLTNIPQLNTSKGNLFNNMFYGCKALTSIPLLDTSNGISFTSMFQNCKALAFVPQLDTSKGKNFRAMFYYCESLVDIPAIDTSNGTDFSVMFSEVLSIKSISAIDTSKGTNFERMFAGCNSLTHIPPLDTSNGTLFNSMFKQCKSLNSDIYLNTSKGKQFEYMFYHCTSLATKPKIDLSNAITTTHIYGGTQFVND